MIADERALRRAVAIVALLNLAYFGIEFAVALAIGSVSLLADSADFFEDAAVNFLIVAFVVYFIIVLPYNKLADLFTGEKAEEDTEVSLLSEIRDLMDPEGAAERAKAEKDGEDEASEPGRAS